jgi:hypothetical protein
VAITTPRITWLFTRFFEYAPILLKIQSPKRASIGGNLVLILVGRVKKGEDLPQFLECVWLPTLPPYRSDTSINFFLGSEEKGLISLLWGMGIKRAESPSIRAAGGKRYKWGRGVKPPRND